MLCSIYSLTKKLSCYATDPAASTSNRETPVLRNNKVKAGQKLETSCAGVFEKKCLFCKKGQKKVKGTKQPLTRCTLATAEEFIKNLIKVNEDQYLNAAVGNVNSQLRKFATTTKAAKSIQIKQPKFRVRK